jgi:hypothetical protein
MQPPRDIDGIKSDDKWAELTTIVDDEAMDMIVKEKRRRRKKLTKVEATFRKPISMQLTFAGVTNLLERDKLGRRGGTHAWAAVSDRGVGERELTQIIANHVGLYIEPGTKHKRMVSQ